MALIRYVSSDGNLSFAIVADDTQADYVWPSDDPEDAWFDTAERLQMLIELNGNQPPTDAQGWLDLASQHLGAVTFANEEVADLQTGLKTAMRQLVAASQPGVGFATTPGAAPAANAFDAVLPDYPMLSESDENDEDVDPQATLHWALNVLGPIDPSGLNGWILRAADGNPQPGDENSYVHWDLPQYTPSDPVATEAPSE